jgi:hypothetical protein
MTCSRRARAAAVCPSATRQVSYCDDDFLVFADDEAFLADVRGRAAEVLARLRLRLHPRKNIVFPVRDGIPFLGYCVFATHRRLAKANVWRFRRRLRRLQGQYARHEIGSDQVVCRVLSWVGHACHADTYRLRERLFREHPFRRTAAP